MTADELADVIASLRGIPELGEAVDQLAHALQTAALAIAAGADDDLVLAAALHDIGRAPDVSRRYRGLPHEASGAAFVAEFASARASWLVGAHVNAKRALVAQESYAELLSPVSAMSLIAQGGPMEAREVAAFNAQPWAADAIALRRWDDAAKRPGAPTPSIAEIVARLP